MANANANATEGNVTKNKNRSKSHGLVNEVQKGFFNLCPQDPVYMLCCQNDNLHNILYLINI